MAVAQKAVKANVKRRNLKSVSGGLVQVMVKAWRTWDEVDVANRDMYASKGSLLCSTRNSRVWSP
jgi:hypothetical protein